MSPTWRPRLGSEQLAVAASWFSHVIEHLLPPVAVPIRGAGSNQKASRPELVPLQNCTAMLSRMGSCVLAISRKRFWQLSTAMF